jgi:hypothetical protein
MSAPLSRALSVPELDLNLIGLYRVQGKSSAAMPGLAALIPPRRAAHGRDRDRLIVYLALGGNVPFTVADYETLTSQVSEKFFRTSGSLTFALKTAVEAANTALVERNMRTTGRGQYAMALLALGALRGNQFYLVQCGPSHAFWLGAGEPRHYYEPQLAGRGLGFSQTPRLYFAHIELRPGDRLVLAAQLPAEWEQALLSERGPASFEATRRRLLASNAPDLHAALIQAQVGTGQVAILAPPVSSALAEGTEGAKSPGEPASLPPIPYEIEEDTLAVPPMPPNLAGEKPASTGPAGSRLSAFTAPSVPSVMPDLPPGAAAPLSPLPEREADGNAIPLTQQMETGPATPAHSVAEHPGRAGAAPPQTVGDRPVPVMTRQPVSARAQRKRRGQGIFLALAKAMHATRLFFFTLGARTKAFLPRLLPNLQEETPNPGTSRGGVPSTSRGMSRSTLLFIAIAVPVLIATMAAMVYFERGRADQFQVYYARASQEASQALAVSDPAAQRERWQMSLYWLDQAESYASSPESKSLRAQAQNSLDVFDRITRLDYQHALPGKLSGNIVRMAANESDLYMLDGTDGKVQRAFRSEQGYTLDGSFQCSPGTYEDLTVGPLVDLVTLPATNAAGADILAVDGIGNALYCGPDLAPQPFQLAPPPEPLQQITAIASDEDSLYVLDATGRDVWQYQGSQGFFNSTPLSFFGLEVPPLETAVDMTVLAGNLFLLHSDGHLTSCGLNLIPTVAPTRCTDPAMLVDTRSGNPSGATLSGTSFSQIQNTPPPNSDVTLLDGPAQAIYRFSPSLLELQDQLRAEPGQPNPLPQGVPASAFTISPNHTVFLVVDGNLFYADESSP